MSGIGTILRSFGGEGKTSVQALVKNAALQAALNEKLSDYSGGRIKNIEDLGKFVAEWQAGQPGAEARGGEEIANLDEFFNGGLANKLSALRTSKKAATTAAGKQALDYATKDRNLSRILSGAGDSSYNKRLGVKQANDVLIRNALEDANQERADVGWLEQAKLNLTGKRQSIKDMIAQRILQPAQTRSAMNMSDMGFLLPWQQAEGQNMFRGLKYKKSGAEKWADVTDSVWSDVMDVASIASSFMGGQGQAQGKTIGSGGNAQPNWNWGGGQGNYGASSMPLDAPQGWGQQFSNVA